LNEDKTKVEFSIEELEGVPEDNIKAFENVPDKEGFKYVSL